MEEEEEEEMKSIHKIMILNENLCQIISSPSI
jgi:hypothetical protein